jgi:hypothetical protein
MCEAKMDLEHVEKEFAAYKKKHTMPDENTYRDQVQSLLWL